MDAPRDDSSSVDPARWVEEHGDLLFRYAYARLGNRIDAEDLVQETFLAALENSGSFEHRARTSTWLVGILRHKVLDSLRRKATESRWREQAERELAAGDPTTGRPQDIPGFSGTVTELERVEIFGRIDAIVRDMPEVMRQVFLLTQIDGLEAVDIGDILGLSRANVWTLLHRARNRLREALLAESATDAAGS